MGTSYETDIVAWANEQAALLRAGNLSSIDALNIAEEIESVARTERRELKHRIAVLAAHLLKWKFQPERRSKSWRATIRQQRREAAHALMETPSLHHALDDESWLALVWSSAVTRAINETSLDFPESWVWPLDQVLDPDFWPDQNRRRPGGSLSASS